MAHHWVLAWWKVRGWPKSYADVWSCFPCISFQTHNSVHPTQNVMTPEENNPTPNPKSCLVWHNSIFIRHPDGLVIVCSSEHLRGDNCCLDCAVTTDNRNMFTTQRAVCKQTIGTKARFHTQSASLTGTSPLKLDLFFSVPSTSFRNIHTTKHAKELVSSYIWNKLITSCVTSSLLLLFETASSGFDRDLISFFLDFV